MSVFDNAEEAIFGSPKDPQNQPSMQGVADLFKNVNHTYDNFTSFIASPNTYADDTIVGTNEEGFRYKSVSSGGARRVQNTGFQWFEALPDSKGFYNVIALGATGDGVTDDTLSIQSAFGGAGTTPDHTYVYFPEGTYKITNAIKVYRAGEILRDVKIHGETSEGVLIENSGGGVQSKGIVVGEPDVTDGLWGSATAINTYGVEIRSLGHKCLDIGLWCVYCQDVIIDDIKGYDLVCLAVGNDAADDCENVKISNVVRMNDGRNVAPDAWYSIGMYRTTRFSIDNFQTDYLAAASGTGGSQIVISACTLGHVSGSRVNQATASGRGITLENGTARVTVSNNAFIGCESGIVTFGLTNQDNNICDNNVTQCTFGLNLAAPRSFYSGNYLKNNGTDVNIGNTDSIFNTFVGNYAETWSVLPAIEFNQFVIGNYGLKTKIFVPAVEFKVAGALEQYDANYHITNPGGSVVAFAHLDLAGRTGVVSNPEMVYTRNIASTAINSTLTTLALGGASSTVATGIDTDASTGYKSQPLTFAVGTGVETNSGTQLVATYSSTAAGLSNLIGFTFEFTEFGNNQMVST